MVDLVQTILATRMHNHVHCCTDHETCLPSRRACRYHFTAVLSITTRALQETVVRQVHSLARRITAPLPPCVAIAWVDELQFVTKASTCLFQRCPCKRSSTNCTLMCWWCYWVDPECQTRHRSLWLSTQRRHARMLRESISTWSQPRRVVRWQSIRPHHVEPPLCTADVRATSWWPFL